MVLRKSSIYSRKLRLNDNEQLITRHKHANCKKQQMRVITLNWCLNSEFCH